MQPDPSDLQKNDTEPLACIQLICDLHCTCIYIYIYIYHAYILSCQGHLGRNATAVQLAVDKLGMRPAQDVVEQAVYQFFSLCLPKFKEVDSA